MCVLIIGFVGFIGYYFVELLLVEGVQVLGLDVYDFYYDFVLKVVCEVWLMVYFGFILLCVCIEDLGVLVEVFVMYCFEIVVYLVVQVGVCYFIDNFCVYLVLNIIGMFELFEVVCVYLFWYMLLVLISLVYGVNMQMFYCEIDKVDVQMLFYVVLKKLIEVMVYSYVYLFGLLMMMFCFFMVYGLWGCLDMVLWLFISVIFQGQLIKVFNYGDMWWDFIFVIDLVCVICLLIDVVLGDVLVGFEDSLFFVVLYCVVNIGNGSLVELLEFIVVIEVVIGCIVICNLMLMQFGDVFVIWVDIMLLCCFMGYVFQMQVYDGVVVYVWWFCSYYG